MDVNELLISLDRFSDYVPVLSTVTNLVDIIITKIVFRKDSNTSNPYFDYLKQKNDQMGARALIPFAAVILKPHPKPPAVAKTEDVAKKAINPSESINKAETNYEAKVDEFLSKLVESGYQGSRSVREIRREIIESNKLRLRDLKVLPKEIGNLTNLTVLNLSSNELTDLPIEICNLKNLTELYLSKNKITTLPIKIGMLTNLNSLSLQNNQLKALPSEIGHLTKLTYLGLAENQLTQLPREIGHLTKLNSLDLGANQLTHLPSEIGNLTNLTLLQLRSNKLKVLPSEFCKLTNLVSLTLSGNKLTALPIEISKLTKLEYLYLTHNELTTLPNAICNLTKLTHLSFYNNKLTAIPSEIGKLANLTELNLSRNQLTVLPIEIGNLRSLKGLELYHNQLTVLPVEIGELANLTTLHLNGNQMTTVPVAVRNLTQLTLLALENTPICAVGDETGWGRQELRAHFRDRVIFSEVNAEIMPAGTKVEDVYRTLDEQPIYIAREKFKEVKMAEIPGTKIENGEQFLKEFNKVISRLNFDDENNPGYVSYELLAGDFASNEEGSNREKINSKVLPRLLGYLKTLYGLPLVEGEVSGWQMYEDKKASLIKAINYIMVKFNEIEDRDQLASLFLMFVNGLLHCPTGQKEGIDTVVLALLENKTERSINLTAAVDEEMAKKKNAFFKVAILTKGAENSQNVHLISAYELSLKEELGLSNVLGYEERMGPFGNDPFNKNPANALKVFYGLVTPNRLVDWLLEKVPSVEELKLLEKREELEKRLASGAASPNIVGLANMVKRLEEQEVPPRQQIDQLKRMIAQQTQGKVVLSEGEQNEIRDEIKVLRSKIRRVQQFKPIDISMIIDYILAKEGPENLAKYFTADPSEDRTATLTRDGALQLLIHLGFLKKK